MKGATFLFSRTDHLTVLQINRWSHLLHGVQIHLHPPHSSLLPFSFIGVNGVSEGRRQRRGACSLISPPHTKSSYTMKTRGSLKCAIHLFPPRSLSWQLQLKMTGRANKYLYVRHRPDSWNKRLTGLKSCLALQTDPSALLVQTKERWEINK